MTMMRGVANLNRIETELFHVCQYFPEDSNETVTFTAGGTVNTFGSWVEIVDNNAVTFSSKLSSNGGHVSGVLIEDTSVRDNIYIFEIAYGSSHVVVVHNRFLSATNLIDTVQQGRRRSEGIPVGGNGLLPDEMRNSKCHSSHCFKISFSLRSLKK